MSKFTKAKRNKDKNLRKKKKEKFKRKYRDQAQEEDLCAVSNQKSDHKSISSLNLEFRKLKATATPRAIVRAKLKRDQRLLEKDMKDLCKDVNKLFKSSDETTEDKEGEEDFAAVEDLSKNVSDLIISNDNPEPGFQYTKGQQKRFLQKVRDQKIKYKHEEDQKM